MKDQIKIVLEVKMSRNAIPFEYGFSNLNDCLDYQLKIESNENLRLRWTQIEYRNNFIYNQSEFIS